ncbi:hypothetical protein SLEP1_g45339 [Rubroshorea leprosula]|uniref:3-beta hydroxysteroid dehydrogenase/isomerase domain-containing protein n=1 Tax=Rubroshorea leprosula TaxID=152421 RepID=A0AAV5LIQ5_9ROSI|nr:hypothetical protein SLEP1_g45339 [Rubroshorea leprosula]
MGIVRTLEEEEERMELEEFRRTVLLATAALNRRKDEEEFQGLPVSSEDFVGDCEEEKLVCVTSGVSFLGLSVVNRLLLRGYSVRIIVDNEEDVEKLREMETSGEMMRTGNRNISVVTAKLTEVHGLMEAFDGCLAVLHTSAFVDPAGFSGYSKSMAEIEVKASENVIKACARTASVRYCVLTSSLLACIWRDGTQHELSPVVNHYCWSDESLCMDKKLWYALGKLRAEKAAWRLAEEMGLKLTTICPGLITGPKFFSRNSTATIAYLKGAQEMYADGLLATVDVNRLAEAHACVLEAMNKTASGRYICFDYVIENGEEAENLAREVGIPSDRISGNQFNFIPTRFQLSDRKLTNLMSRISRSCHREC